MLTMLAHDPYKKKISLSIAFIRFRLFYVNSIIA